MWTQPCWDRLQPLWKHCLADWFGCTRCSRDCSPSKKNKAGLGYHPCKPELHKGLQLPAGLYAAGGFVTAEKEGWAGGGPTSCASLCLWVSVAPPRTHTCVCPSAAHSTLACLALAHASVLQFLCLLKVMSRCGLLSAGPHLSLAPLH